MPVERKKAFLPGDAIATAEVALHAYYVQQGKCYHDGKITLSAILGPIDRLGLQRAAGYGSGPQTRRAP